jgi:imidazolonepropionase-like amidohydrolase
MIIRHSLTILLAAALGGAVLAADPGATGGGGLALRASKVLIAAYDGPAVLNHGIVLVKDGLIEAVGPARSTPVPAGYVLVDLGKRWLAPGMIDLHSHVGGTWDINDMVFLTNPGLRANTAVRPGNSNLDRAVAGGVTTILFIPGSGSNMGGQGVLLRTGEETYGGAELRAPGSLKVAQAGNPEGYIFGVGRSFMNWNLRNTFKRGIAYAKRWEQAEATAVKQPDRNPQWEIFRHLRKNEAQVSTHTQVYQVVLATITIIAQELEMPVYIDHGTFDGYRAAELAEQANVPAILGPRSIDAPAGYWFRMWSGSQVERVQGVAAGYQERGHRMVGFNTDAPVVPQEELSLQAAVGVRYGFDNSEMDALRGVTSVPAKAAGIDQRAGSIEVGKEANLLILNGDPIDPRTGVEAVYSRGRKVYDTALDRRRW